MTKRVKPYSPARSLLSFWALVLVFGAFGYLASFGAQRGGVIGALSIGAFFALIAFAFWQSFRPYTGGRMLTLELIAGHPEYDLADVMEIYDVVERTVGAPLPKRMRRGLLAEVEWLRKKGYVVQTGESKFAVTPAGHEALAAYRARHPKQSEDAV